MEKLKKFLPFILLAGLGVVGYLVYQNNQNSGAGSPLNAYGEFLGGGGGGGVGDTGLTGTSYTAAAGPVSTTTGGAGSGTTLTGNALTGSGGETAGGGLGPSPKSTGSGGAVLSGLVTSAVALTRTAGGATGRGAMGAMVGVPNTKTGGALSAGQITSAVEAKSAMPERPSVASVIIPRLTTIKSPLRASVGG